MNDMSCDLKKLKSYYMQFPGVGSLYYYWSVIATKKRVISDWLSSTNGVGPFFS